MSAKKIYVATSWRNPYHGHVIKALRSAGHEPYNFKNPRPGVNGFSWSDIHPDWVGWSLYDYRKALDHPIALAGFSNDLRGMLGSDECLLICPSGRSAHIEAGYLAGTGRTVVALLIDKQEPELMYNCFTRILVGWDEFNSFYGVVPDIQTGEPFPGYK